VSDPKLLVLGPLVLLSAGYTAFFWRSLRAHGTGEPAPLSLRPSRLELMLGALTDFFDTLGIGSFATTTSLFRLWKVVPDRLIPGTLNVGHALPTVAQALIYIAIIEVDPSTLALMIGSAVLGAFLGADVVATWSERKVRLGMSVALLAAAALLLARLLGWLPSGGDAKGLHGLSLALGALGNFVLGALMTLGIGLYAPCMILISLLGMSPQVAFPIMMGSCAFLMPVASARFIRSRSYAPRAALGLALGGVPAVLIAAYVVKQLPLDAVRWLVLCVVVYTASSLLRAARYA
jgi:uncharacterized membrane protein YfcA